MSSVILIPYEMGGYRIRRLLIMDCKQMRAGNGEDSKSTILNNESNKKENSLGSSLTQSEGVWVSGPVVWLTYLPALCGQ